MKEKLITWTENVSKCSSLENFLKTFHWEKENPDLEGKLKQLVSDYLYLLSENFPLCFPESLMMIVNSNVNINGL